MDRIPRPTQLSKVVDRKCNESKKICDRKISSQFRNPFCLTFHFLQLIYCFICLEITESAAKYQIFLGGSCNPTTWRQDIAIPILKNRGITYFNPVWSFSYSIKQHSLIGIKLTAVFLFIHIVCPAASAAMGSGVDWERASRQTDGWCLVLRPRSTNQKHCHYCRSSLLHGSSKDICPRYPSVWRARTTHPGWIHLGTVNNNSKQSNRTFFLMIQNCEYFSKGIWRFSHRSTCFTRFSWTIGHSRFQQYPIGSRLHDKGWLWRHFEVSHSESSIDKSWWMTF